MFKLFFFLVLLLFSLLIEAKETSSFYQIDLVIFTRQQPAHLPTELPLTSTLSTASSHAIPLRIETSHHLSAYHLLPPSSSQLREEYWALHRQAGYHVLLHYTWLQPLNNERTVMLPAIHRDGWQMEGFLRVQRANYYLLTTELLFSKVDSLPFVFAQKQRLKGGESYYFDHPQIGMLIKIHQLG